MALTDHRNLMAGGCLEHPLVLDKRFSHNQLGSLNSAGQSNLRRRQQHAVHVGQRGSLRWQRWHIKAEAASEVPGEAPSHPPPPKKMKASPIACSSHQSCPLLHALSHAALGWNSQWTVTAGLAGLQHCVQDLKAAGY